MENINIKMPIPIKINNVVDVIFSGELKINIIVGVTIAIIDKTTLILSLMSLYLFIIYKI